MMRSAVFPPTPFTDFSDLASPWAMMTSRSEVPKADSISIAVAAPTPLTPMSRRKRRRSSAVAKP